MSVSERVSVGDVVMALRNFAAPNVFNPWSDTDPLDRFRAFAPMDRRTRLWQHFGCKPRFLLIGEAPGYQGCHFSGVPFTNEKLLLEGVIPRVTCDGRITTREKPWSEPSATIVWRTLHELGIAESTVMWNAFAFHPYKPGTPMSNRAPTRHELAGGKSVLMSVLDHFKGARIVAVGQVSAKLLVKLGHPAHALVRHPSMGGARDFRVGMERIVFPERNPFPP